MKSSFWLFLKTNLFRKYGINKLEVMGMKYNFSEDLQSIREILGLSQHDFAEQLGVEQKIISRNESGRTDPSVKFLESVYAYAFTYELSSVQVYKIVKPKELRGLFLPYHTMDPAQAVERILEAKGMILNDNRELERQYAIFKKIRSQTTKRGGAH